MPAEIATALIAASGAIALAGATYWFTKKREGEAELRKEKLDHYKAFVTSLSGIAGISTSESQRIFALACNNLNLIAPQVVIRAMQDFQQEIKVTNKNKSNEQHDKLLSRLLYEMRKDLQIAPKDTDTKLLFGLWTGGPGTSPENRKHQPHGNRPSGQVD